MQSLSVTAPSRLYDHLRGQSCDIIKASKFPLKTNGSYWVIFKGCLYFLFGNEVRINNEQSSHTH